MIVYGIDPGYEQSAAVGWNGSQIVSHSIVSNDALIAFIRALRHDTAPRTVVIEQIESMGMAVGKAVFETVYWSGRFAEAYFPCPVQRVTRHEIKLHLCGQRRAKDAEVRQAILDRFGATKEKAIGKKATPGPLFGITSHEWSALEVALTWWDQHNRDELTGEIVRPGVIGQF